MNVSTSSSYTSLEYECQPAILAHTGLSIHVSAAQLAKVNTSILTRTFRVRMLAPAIRAETFKSMDISTSNPGTILESRHGVMGKTCTAPFKSIFGLMSKLCIMVRFLAHDHD
jgi:hypothetical protein